MRAAVAEMESLGESMAQARQAGGLGSMPLIVLTRGPVRADEPPKGVSPRTYEEFERVWRGELQPAMARLLTRGEQRFAMHSGHMVPHDEPEAVVRVIADLVATAQR